MQKSHGTDGELRVLLAHGRAADASAAEEVLKAADSAIVTKAAAAKSSFLAALSRFKPHAVVMDCGVRGLTVSAARRF